jgi:hypothetical protein
MVTATALFVLDFGSHLTEAAKTAHWQLHSAKACGKILY